ncbi:MAG: hypothetical protein QOD06_3537 [Candidatus Binatota bacterium]|nr:hypothetical protein [Candidatus Binatota bacterium]
MRSPERPRPPSMPTAAVERFLKSMILDVDRWRDGEGYDLRALDDLTTAERAYVLEVLTERLVDSGADWRDVDAVAALGTREANTTLASLCSHRSGVVRLRAARILAERDLPDVLEREIVRLLGDPRADAGVGQLMALAEANPTAGVRQALLACAVDGAPELRVHAAALALYLAGGSVEAFDWTHRPLFLRFAEEDREARRAALGELKAMIPTGDRRGAR